MNGVMAATMATFVLFAQELLLLDGLGFGLLLATGSLGGLLGSVLAPRVTAWLGGGRSLLLIVAAPIVGFTVIALTSSPVLAGLAFAAYFFTAVTWNVVTVSLRQTLIPDAMLGRVNSVYRFFGWGVMPIGTLLGGGLVRLVEEGVSRPAGLRAPFVAAAMIHVVLLATASPRLTQAAIDEARAAAPST